MLLICIVLVTECQLFYAIIIKGNIVTDQMMKIQETKSWERARSPQQKDAREKEILQVTRDLLFAHPFDKISLSMIAKGLSFTRANLYKYFHSKEEICLALLADEIFRFGRRFEQLNEAYEGDISLESFLDLWVPNLAAEKHMLQLLSMAGNILEKNCSDEILLRAKLTMAMSLQYFQPTLRRFFPSKKEEDYPEMMNILIITANGLYSFCGLSTHQKQLLRANGMEGMIHDFETDYRKLLSGYLEI